MRVDATVEPPPTLPAIIAESRRLGFALASDQAVGALLRALAAATPGGNLLELGTGTGAGAAWLLDGMDPDARLTTVEPDPELVAVARRMLGHDPRVRIVAADGDEWLPAADERYDLIFADAMPGKYRLLDEALALLAPGGIYVIDDMLPQPTWPDGHAALAAGLTERLIAMADMAVAPIAWATGVIVAVKRPTTA